MAQELIYTSAPKGLKPGSSGFCTVACTGGLPPPLLSLLEGLSGYQPAFAPEDPRARENPVAFQLVHGERGARQYILSRIGYAGLDYTGRSNKIAHHLVLAEGELAEAGPAAVLKALEACGALLSNWQGIPDSNRAPVRIPQPSPPSSPLAGGWGRAAGDAGWAGVLAQAYLEQPGTPVSVIYEPGCDTLGLIGEALVLLPPEARWQVSFSTYFTSLARGTTCCWRFVLAETPAAKEAGLRRNQRVIDLRSPGSIDVDAPLVQVARSGEWPTAPVADAPPSETSILPLIAASETGGQRPVNAPTARRVVPAPTLRQAPSRPSIATPPTPVRERPRKSGKIIAAVCLAAMLAGAFWLMSPSRRDKPDSAVEAAPVEIALSQPVISSDHRIVRIPLQGVPGEFDFADYANRTSSVELASNGATFAPLPEKSKVTLVVPGKAQEEPPESHASGSAWDKLAPPYLEIAFPTALTGANNRIRLAPGAFKADGVKIGGEFTSDAIDTSADVIAPTFEITWKALPDGRLEIILDASEGGLEVNRELAEILLQPVGQAEPTPIDFEMDHTGTRIAFVLAMPPHGDADLLELGLKEGFAQDAGGNRSEEVVRQIPAKELAFKEEVAVEPATPDGDDTKPADTGGVPPEDSRQTLARGVWLAWHRAAAGNRGWDGFAVEYDGIAARAAVVLAVDDQERFKADFIKQNGSAESVNENSDFPGGVVAGAVVNGVPAVTEGALNNTYRLEPKYRIEAMAGRIEAVPVEDGRAHRDVIKPGDVSRLSMDGLDVPLRERTPEAARVLGLAGDLAAKVEYSNAVVRVTVKLAEADEVFLGEEALVTRAARGEWQIAKTNDTRTWTLAAAADGLFKGTPVGNAIQKKVEQAMPAKKAEREKQADEREKGKAQAIYADLEKLGFNDAHNPEQLTKWLKGDGFQRRFAAWARGQDDIKKLCDAEKWGDLKQHLVRTFPTMRFAPNPKIAKLEGEIAQLRRRGQNRAAHEKNKELNRLRLQDNARRRNEQASFAEERDEAIELLNHVDRLQKLPAEKQQWVAGRIEADRQACIEEACRELITDAVLTEAFPGWDMRIEIGGCYSRRLVLQSP